MKRERERDEWAKMKMTRELLWMLKNEIIFSSFFSAYTFHHHQVKRERKKHEIKKTFFQTQISSSTSANSGIAQLACDLQLGTAKKERNSFNLCLQICTHRHIQIYHPIWAKEKDSKNLLHYHKLPPASQQQEAFSISVSSAWTRRKVCKVIICRRITLFALKNTSSHLLIKESVLPPYP